MFLIQVPKRFRRQQLTAQQKQTKKAVRNDQYQTFGVFFFFGFWILLSKFIEKEINKKSNVKKHVPHVACITNIMLIF